MPTFLPGDETWFATDSPTSRFSAVFEDDGETAWFYAYERLEEGSGRILDAVHIYDVSDVVDRERESEAEMRWSPSGLRVALFINGRAHALIDFAESRVYCRGDWPPPGGPWGESGEPRRPWDDGLLERLRT